MSRVAVDQDELPTRSGGLQRSGLGLKQEPTSRFILAGGDDIRLAVAAMHELVAGVLKCDPSRRRRENEGGHYAETDKEG